MVLDSTVKPMNLQSDAPLCDIHSVYFLESRSQETAHRFFQQQQQMTS
jgi:hypothetical protein